MIALSPMVLEWYRQQATPPLAIFKEAASKQRRISIHEIINLNAGGKVYTPGQGYNMGNTLVLLSLRRKRQRLTLESLRMMGQPHQVTGDRIARAWNRANSRKAG
ncbi:hypothetical protein P7_176 [Pectobacterium phage vB_PcaM_P7_Pc]|nr:hypothetical protein P7_176 [Pectobacterium phage vB_PcaM_P7_Pc]